MKKAIFLGAFALLAVSATSALADKEKWADLVEVCLQKEGVLAPAGTRKGCYVTPNYRIYCKKEIAEKCSDEANEQRRPERRGSRSAAHSEPADGPERR